VYVSLRNTPARAGAVPALLDGRTRGAIGRNVVLLGLVSLFTDVSQEMVVAVLPLYLTLQLGLGPLAFGLMDGVYQGGTALVRILGGLLADRRDRHKQVAGFGYALSAVCKLGLLAAGSAWGAVSAVLVLDRLGKGVRTAPRDALISLSADPRALGRAFGVHRALDTTGALLGPLLAFVLLARRPGAYGGIFVTSFAIALIGLGILILFVQGRSGRGAETPEPAVSLRSALALLHEREFRTITIVGGALGLFTISDAFVYLLIQRQTNMDARWFPLLFLGTALSYLLLAVPIGQLADRVGRGRVFLVGYLPLVATYLVLLFVPLRTPVVLLCLALLGSYYASTDGILMAAASSRVSERLRTSGLAIVTTATASTRFVASIGFGGLWVVWGPHRSTLVFLLGLLAAVAASTALLRPEAS
jgi:MFS family permease